MQIRCEDFDAEGNGERNESDSLLPPPPLFTLRPPSCEPLPPSPTATLWTSETNRGIQLKHFVSTHKPEIS